MMDLVLHNARQPQTSNNEKNRNDGEPERKPYESICALERTPPRKGYFELDAQPPMTIP